jgi:type I restriction enzyme, S subunit
MSRGRKAVVHNNSDWESVFYNSVGTYVQYINLRLAEHIKSEPLSNHIKIVGGYAFKSSQYKKQGIPGPSTI